MKIIRTGFIVPLILAAATAACAPETSSVSDTSVSRHGTATVTGSVLYRERIAPPPGATVRFTLEDVSLADAPSVTIATQEYQIDGKAPPYAFKLTTPRSKLEARRTYQVRATIVGADGKLLWTTDMANRIDPTAVDQDLPHLNMVKVN